MDRLDVKALDRIRGSAWDSLRPQFETIHNALINLGEKVSGDLTTIYVKYRTSAENPTPFAVVWIKNSKSIVVGLAYSGTCPNGLTDNLAGFKYAGLTAYLVVKPGEEIPKDFTSWIKNAFETVANY